MIALIIVCILFIVFILVLWINRPKDKKKNYRAVRAGDANANRISPTTIEYKDLFKNRYVFDNKYVDPNDYEIFVVDGNSMSYGGIKDRDVVFSHRLFGPDKFNIEGNPVLIFEIDRYKELSPECTCSNMDVEFKLRKFISYVKGGVSIENFFNGLEPEIRDVVMGDKDEIIDKFGKCTEKYKQINAVGNNDFRLIFSSTFDVDKNKLRYSFHPVKFLYGIVDYVVPKDKIYK